MIHAPIYRKKIIGIEVSGKLISERTTDAKGIKYKR